MTQKGINKSLARDYGRALSGNPTFRVSWSDKETEIRKGTFNEFYGSIFIRTYVGVRRVPKYSYIKSRWILERWIPGESFHSDVLLENKVGSYEPLYVFTDADDGYLPLNYEVLQFVIRAAFDQQSTSLTERKSKALEAHNKKELKDEAFFNDALNEDSWTHYLLSTKSAVLNSKGE